MHLLDYKSSPSMKFNVEATEIQLLLFQIHISSKIPFQSSINAPSPSI